MQNFFQFHTKQEPFRLFSKEHIITIAIIFVLCLLLFIFRRQLEKQGLRMFLRFFLLFLLIASDIGYHIWLVSENAWSPKDALPLHLSDLSVLLAIVLLFTKNLRLFQFLYFAGLGSSIQAILTPDLGRFSFPHFQYIEFFISHGGVVLTCLFMVLAFHYRPTLRSLWMTVLIVNIYGVCVFFLNKWLGANYLYIMNKPKNASLLDFLGPWPWYLLSVEVIMIIIFYLLYSPFWLKRKFDGSS
ncbi:membrane protein [Bacillus sp. SA1-12]|uniref:YwaF family protein n=1 Tax=Bacillus sp. SA1-12 TaxID=1455638 RepID=UPI0006269AF9|nr:TIGR02206 family membrane protein [Bacillus sp. SA1-12]KKI92003.1 membrane protein [Bacillus sp. SA1-12]